MKRHKRKQKQWSKRLTPTALPVVLATHHSMPSLPELSILDRMMEDPEIAAIVSEATHANHD